jgi:GNAT superfamily N-acetyltransferase
MWVLSRSKQLEVDMGWRQRWFNLSPGPNWSFLIDRKGQKYWYQWKDEAIPALCLWHKGEIVARVNLLWKPPTCELADIVISNPKLRRRGLGKSLIQEVIQHVRTQGMTILTGTIIPGGGGEPFEYLTEWYSRQGFTVNRRKLFFDLR